MASESIPSSAAPTARADIVLVHGKVFTDNPAHRFAEALAIAADRIIAVGTTLEIASLAHACTHRIDLGGRTVVPGFNDAHVHHTPDPRAIVLPVTTMEPTWEEMLDAVAAAVQDAPRGMWILGTHGLTVVNEARATRFELDRVAPAHPVRLNAYFGHGSVYNTRALTALAISDEEPDPLGGCCERVAGARRITGKLFGYAQWGPWRRLAELASVAEAIASAQQLAQEALQFGVTSLQVFTLMPTDRYVRALERAKLPIRVRVIRFPQTHAGARDLAEGRALPRRSPAPARVTVTGTKWLLDGTPLERRAALRTEYRDRPGWSGEIYLPEAEMRAMLRESVAHDDPLLVHAVGDKTVATFLNAMEAESTGVAWKPRRVRMEHGDGLLPDLVPRASDLGVIVVQNPSHFAFNDVFAARYGEAHAYMAARSLIEAGIPFALGSDGPRNPYLNLLFAVTHPGRPSEALTMEQAVDAYTRGAAHAEFEDEEKGTLAPGKLADLAVLSQDIFTIPPSDLLGTESVLTMIGGDTAYDAGVLTAPR